MAIRKDSLVEDVLKGHPHLTRVFIQQGIPCLVCGESFWGTIEELARQYGKDVDTLVDELNKQDQSQNDAT
jgi:hybrid cluster-associated redox disulfide protein